MKRIIEIKEDVKVGNVILEKGDKIEVLTEGRKEDVNNNYIAKELANSIVRDTSFADSIEYYEVLESDTRESGQVLTDLPFMRQVLDFVIVFYRPYEKVPYVRSSGVFTLLVKHGESSVVVERGISGIHTSIYSGESNKFNIKL